MQAEVLAYVPPPGQGRNPEAFLANIQSVRTRFPLSLFSDHPAWGLRHCENPNRVRNNKFPYFVSNFTFFLALQYSLAAKLDRFILLEDDCRVRGDFFDEKMMTEAEKIRPDFIVAGSPVAYNVSDSGHRTLRRVIEYAHAYLQASGFALPIYGFMPNLALYVNGAMAIYDTQIMAKVFNGFSTDIGRWACMPQAWDLKSGEVFFQMFGEDVFNLVVPLTCTYSGCGDRIYNEPERIQMLESGKVCGIHQVKSAYK